MRRPRAVAAQEFPQIQPQPGGVRREYWIQAETAALEHRPRPGATTGTTAGSPVPSSFRAYVYRAMTPRFAEPMGGFNMPGPTLHAEVGDVLVVHFRNADRRLRQAVTMHPHGVRYSPEYDGAYMGEYTRTGGFVGPGETFTYQWECPPESVGAWPYHDHGPNHTLNTFRGLFGSIIVRPRGAKPPDRLYTLFAHQLPPPVTRLGPQLPVRQRPRLRRQHADAALARRARTSSCTARHGRRRSTRSTSTGTAGATPPACSSTTPRWPNETVTARFTEDNPGRWLYHCHVFSHRTAG